MDIKNFDFIFSNLEKNSADVMEHSERTAILCYATTKELNLDPEERELAYFSGLLHEIGKINFPLLKKTNDSIELEKFYPYFTISILSVLEGSESLQEVILQHQENIDGSGYPNGLEGEEINLIARILRIADFYDKQRSSGLTHDETTKLLRENSDIIFPRRIITPFIKAIIKNELQNDYIEK